MSSFAAMSSTSFGISFSVWKRPCVQVAHYDEQFEGGLPRTKTPLPRRATIQDLFPDVATSVPHASLRTHLS